MTMKIAAMLDCEKSRDYRSWENLVQRAARRRLGEVMRELRRLA
jgi:hypothetical protein